MLSLDANLLFYAYNSACPEHALALEFVKQVADREDVAISEFILCEFYLLLRNPAILQKPLEAAAAADVVASYRRHPRWKCVGFPGQSRALHDALWTYAAASDFPRRRLFDVRTALALQSFGVREFATANTRDFLNLGFHRLWNPLQDRP